MDDLAGEVVRMADDKKDLGLEGVKKALNRLKNKDV